MIFYDFEVFYQNWLIVCMDTKEQKTTVIVDDREQLIKYHEKNIEDIWVGFNSRHYDQWILKGIICGFNPKEINDHIILKKQGGWSFSSLLNKVELLNYDIMTSLHSLKQLEGFMGNNIKESSVSFNIERELSENEIEEVIDYCKHDVNQTMEVFLNRIEEFTSHMSLITEFKLPMKYVNKTKAQLAAIILKARRKDYNDEFEITIPDTIKLNKYKWIETWYRDKNNLNYEKRLETDIAGVPHIFAFGGLHGAIPNYYGEGIFLNVDVASYYPSLMIEYGFASRSIEEKGRYNEIYNTRLELKAQKDKKQLPYKITLNSAYGAMKDKYNSLYDPLQANNVCIAGQLMLLDLIEKLENEVQLIQSNTDGILVKLKSMKDYEKVVSICSEWEMRTRMKLEYDLYTKVIQKDVNNYIIVDFKGNYKSKGAYVKKLNTLDYDLPIINKALVNKLLHGIEIEETINKCDELKEFQRVVKVSGKYKYAIHNNEILNEKVLRVFASRRISDGAIYKVKNINKEKIANTPERCFIDNSDVKEKKIPRHLNKNWYISMANKRLDDFLGEDCV